ncbi:hypothetical protein HHI36_010315 [Cryptolaemus montrouzieri]|uniref:CCD97-like C-terminal domain-containing protein n=1 Tax=Cryptolaemus montrouzieri TaxID=559131 RepID=A0ABD2MIE1_9CUCU
MTMEIDSEPPAADPPLNVYPDIELETEVEEILNFLTDIEEICFKSQQRGEADLTKMEKFRIGADAFNKNKLNFLIRFGDHLLLEHLTYFKKFTYGNDEESNNLNILLTDLSNKATTNGKSYKVKNRRYEALQQMIPEDNYFSEIEMMKRNPLLYEKLVGQYLTRDEIRERDKFNTEQTSFVKILMEGIERDDAAVRKKKDEDLEDCTLAESESDSDEVKLDEDDRSRSPIATRCLWGEFENEGYRRKPKVVNVNITVQERKLLKEEFITTMYQSFLDGKDTDFDYSQVDNNGKYDSVETIERDEEDKYFDSEEPADAPLCQVEDGSEDELDIYMSGLNDNPSVKNLSSDMKKISTQD